MIAERQIREMQNLVKDLETRILNGTLSLEEYKAKCAERKAYLRAIEIVKTVSVEEEE